MKKTLKEKAQSTLTSLDRVSMRRLIFALDQIMVEAEKVPVKTYGGVRDINRLSKEYHLSFYQTIAEEIERYEDLIEKQESFIKDVAKEEYEKLEGYKRAFERLLDARWHISEPNKRITFKRTAYPKKSEYLDLSEMDSKYFHFIESVVPDFLKLHAHERTIRELHEGGVTWDSNETRHRKYPLWIKKEDDGEDDLSLLALARGVQKERHARGVGERTWYYFDQALDLDLKVIKERASEKVLDYDNIFRTNLIAEVKYIRLLDGAIKKNLLDEFEGPSAEFELFCKDFSKLYEGGGKSINPVTVRLPFLSFGGLKTVEIEPTGFALVMREQDRMYSIIHHNGEAYVGLQIVNTFKKPQCIKKEIYRKFSKRMSEWFDLTSGKYLELKEYIKNYAQD
jgi:hypothetical protein